MYKYFLSGGDQGSCDKIFCSSWSYFIIL